MSKWTHVRGVIIVDSFGRSDAESIYIVQTVVNNLPLITGSERNVEYHINLLNRPTSYSETDEFGRNSNLSKWFETRTNAIISMFGELRDRTFNITTKEVVNTLNRLSKRLIVNDCLISVCDDTGNSYMINNPKWILNTDLTDYVQKRIFQRDIK